MENVLQQVAGRTPIKGVVTGAPGQVLDAVADRGTQSFGKAMATLPEDALEVVPSDEVLLQGAKEESSLEREVGAVLPIPGEAALPSSTAAESALPRREIRAAPTAPGFLAQTAPSNLSEVSTATARFSSPERSRDIGQVLASSTALQPAGGKAGVPAPPQPENFQLRRDDSGKAAKQEFISAIGPLVPTGQAAPAGMKPAMSANAKLPNMTWTASADDAPSAVQDDRSGDRGASRVGSDLLRDGNVAQPLLISKTPVVRAEAANSTQGDSRRWGSVAPRPSQDASAMAAGATELQTGSAQQLGAETNTEFQQPQRAQPFKAVGPDMPSASTTAYQQASSSTPTSSGQSEPLLPSPKEWTADPSIEVTRRVVDVPDARFRVAESKQHFVAGMAKTTPAWDINPERPSAEGSRIDAREGTSVVLRQSMAQAGQEGTVKPTPPATGAEQVPKPSIAVQAPAENGRSLSSRMPTVSDEGQSVGLAQSDAPSRAAPPPALVVAAPTDTSRTAAIVQQIADATRGAAGGQIEVSLSPEELGRVRITLTPHEAGMNVAIHADRSETLDLLKRNLDILARELEQQGFHGASFSFAERDTGSAFAKGGPEREASIAAHPTELTVTESPAHYAAARGSALDLRL